MLRLIFGPGWDASTESCNVCPASFGDLAAEATIARRRRDARSRDEAAFADRALRQEAGTNEERMCGSPECVISRLNAKRSCGIRTQLLVEEMVDQVKPSTFGFFHLDKAVWTAAS